MASEAADGASSPEVGPRALMCRRVGDAVGEKLHAWQRVADPLTPELLLEYRSSPGDPDDVVGD